MAKTPEGLVKKEVKDFLDSYGSRVYYHMPVQAGFGKRGLDFFVCYKGMFIAIETKRWGGYGKKFQVDLVEEVRDAHGHAMIIDNVAQVKALFDYIDTRF